MFLLHVLVLLAFIPSTYQGNLSNSLWKIEQVQQYKHERECNAIIGQTREDKIVRLESLMDGVLSKDDFLDEEFASLMHEHKVMFSGVSIFNRKIIEEMFPHMYNAAASEGHV